MIGEGRFGGERDLRTWLMASVALLSLTALPAQAASLAPAGASDEALATADGLDLNSFYLEADNVTENQSANLVTAEGHVEVRYRGRTLRGQKLVYETDTGVVTAQGDVVVINPDGAAEFSREVVLDKDLQTGVAIAFSARLKGNVKLAADSVIRRSEDLTELNRAIYTPCEICTKAGNPKQPTWSIQASKVVQDKDRHVIYYQHAVIKVLGMPVFYAPVFWHPDVDAKAQSGFLAPKIEVSRKRGLSYEQPYVFAISPSQDLVVSPILNTEVSPFLNLDWRKRFYSGQVDVRLGYTYAREFNNSGETIPGSDLTSRSYILADGAFDLNSKWTWGFGAERVSDDLLFDRYDIGGVYNRRGLFETDSRRLLSQIYTVRQDQNSYLSISALNFQGLRIGDVNAAMPIVAPLVEGRYEPEGAILGGRLRMTGSAVVLSRDRDTENASLPGVDSRRATAQAEWRGAYTLLQGIRVEPFASARGDLYSLNDLPVGQDSKTVGRSQGALGVNVSWPLIKRAGDATIILEPMAEAVVSPRASSVVDIPNQDSANFVFDETNLFDPNRAPGFDVYDSGARLNVGGRATINWGAGRQARAFFGRSFRSSRDLTLPVRSGYTDRASDWILAASATPVRGLTVYTRTQLDGNDLSLRRQEAGANVVLPFIRGYARYLHDYTDPGGERENIELAGDVFLTKNWGVVLYGSRDMQRGIWARRDFGVMYQDDCTRIELIYHHEDAFVRLGGPSNSVQLRLTLATLGEQGYRDRDRR